MSFSGMPGTSFSGPLPPLTGKEEALALALRMYVGQLAALGPRHALEHDKLNAAAEWIADRFASSGRQVVRHTFHTMGVGDDAAAVCENIEMVQLGASRPHDVIVLGAHYDTVVDSPGANDNASGVAALLGLSAALAGAELARTVRFVAFANEEHPYYRTPAMGSWNYAKDCRKRADDVVAMISLETLGYYTDEPDSQTYPPPLDSVYPSIGNFVAFVGNVASHGLVRRAVHAFRDGVQFPCEGEALPDDVPGIGWSDHWAFWQEGYEAMMVTDTAPFRYPHYHLPTDTADKLDYERMARVVAGLEVVVRALANPPA